MSSEGIVTLQKSLFSHTLLCAASLFFFLKEWRQSNSPKYLFLLIMVIVFLGQDNAVVFLHLKSLKGWRVFLDLSYELDIFFLSYKTLRATGTLFSPIFSTHLLLTENLFLPSYIIYKRFHFYYSLQIFFHFFSF